MQDNNLATARELTKFENWNERIGQLRERIRHSAIEVDKFVDEIAGTVPNEIAGAGPTQDVTSAADGMDKQISNLDSAVDKLTYVVNRLWDSNLVHRPGILDEMAQEKVRLDEPR